MKLFKLLVLLTARSQTKSRNSSLSWRFQWWKRTTTMKLQSSWMSTKRVVLLSFYNVFSEKVVHQRMQGLCKCQKALVKTFRGKDQLKERGEKPLEAKLAQWKFLHLLKKTYSSCERAKPEKSNILSLQVSGKGPKRFQAGCFSPAKSDVH